MKIIHLCLSGFFIDDSLYQDNELVRMHLDAGHEVLIVASTEVFDAGGNVTYAEPSDYVGAEGARVIRLPYRSGLPHRIARKVRAYPDVRSILESFEPDVIMFHGSAAWDLLTVAKYAREHPDVIFNIDSHSDANNSGHGVISKEILHKRFYGPILRKAMRHSGSLLCVSTSVMEFAKDVYKIRSEKLEFFPLGGRIPSLEKRRSYRASVRERLGTDNSHILIVQSGKQNRLKKLPQSLRALAQVENPSLRLVIAGVLQDDVREECEALIADDPRVTFLGWQSSNDLTELLCAADIYLQPGTQSATMQQSLCCGCAIILDDVAAHHPYISGNGWMIHSDEDLRQTLEDIPRADIESYKAASLRLAESELNYRKLADRILARVRNV